MKAQIFIKFYVVINYYLVNLNSKFHEDLCSNAHTPVVNARTRINAQIFMKFGTFVHKIVIDDPIKFHEGPSFRCGDICKTILTYI